MARALMVYDLPSTVVLASAQAQATSANTGDVQTLTAPTRAAACVLAARTNDAYVVFNGTTPSSSNGMPIIAGAQPVMFFIQPKNDIKFASSQAANSILNVLWLE